MMRRTIHRWVYLILSLFQYDQVTSWCDFSLPVHTSTRYPYSPLLLKRQRRSRKRRSFWHVESSTKQFVATTTTTTTTSATMESAPPTPIDVCDGRSSSHMTETTTTHHPSADLQMIPTSIQQQQQQQPTTIEETLDAYGMPWRSSIDPNYKREHLFYMPFWEWQLSFLKKNLKNLKVIPSKNRSQTKDLTYVENTQKKKRMITLCFESDEYRLIRMTLLDAGSATQVFTSLWYPRAHLPVLGIDLLQFNNAKKHLTVVDFQPIHTHEEEHDTTYERLMRPIRSRYPSLQYTMSDKFYDENQFFSSEMLLGRGNTTDYVWTDLMPAYRAYTKLHVKLTKEYYQLSSPNDDEDDRQKKVLIGQKSYDDYSSVRDPAHGLLASIFGKSYADEFVYDVLFPLSDGLPASNLDEK